MHDMQVQSDDSVGKLKGNVEMEHPNKLIDSFTGVLSIESSKEPIQLQNILLRGCVVRNTEWIIGLVLNTGHDTKIMMSSVATKAKVSSLDAASSQQIRKIIILLSIVCFTGAVGNTGWNQAKSVDSLWYLHLHPNPAANWFLMFAYFFLLHSSFIPVSLYVSMSVVRFYQSFFMNNDLEMYFDKTDSPAMVRTMTLNEELGQISHIFSDKTGTLTCNVMDFRKMSVAGVVYGEGITEIGRAAWKLIGKEVPDSVLRGEERAQQAAVPHVSFYCPRYEEHMTAGPMDAASRLQRERINNFFRVLSICHDVIPEHIDGKVKLSASNPGDLHAINVFIFLLTILSW